jgi:hypothetical protein
MQDITLANCLVNHFGAYPDESSNLMRQKLRSDGHLIYAICDFDIAIMFPSTTTPAERRLPSNLSWDGGFNQPHDTKQGELDYDPFVFDVGCLGVLFCREFQVCLLYPVIYL